MAVATVANSASVAEIEIGWPSSRGGLGIICQYGIIQ
jgi:hypothetical protein